MQCAPNISASRFFKCLCLLILFSIAIFAEQLPLKIFSTADGLANDSVNKIVTDSRGFLWICTGEGLSRFDGYSFKNYSQEDGLPHRSINDFLETKEGDYLIATQGGLVVFNPNGKSYRWNINDDKLEQNSSEPPLFKTYLPSDLPNPADAKNVLSIAQDRNGAIYVATRYGLYHLIKTNSDWQFQRFENPQLDADKVATFGSLFTDSRGDIWMSAGKSVYRILNSGEVQKISEPVGGGFFEDKDGNIWVNPSGNDFGIRVFSIQNNEPVLKNLYTRKDGLGANRFSNAIAQESSGRIFVSSQETLYEFIPQAKDGEPKFRSLERSSNASAINKNGTIWFATNLEGIARYTPNSFQTFNKKDGLTNDWIGRISGNQEGDVFLSMGFRRLARFKDGKIETIEVSGIRSRYWMSLDLFSQAGEFWASSDYGLLRFPKTGTFNDLSHTSPKKIYTTADGLFGNDIAVIFEDSRGDIWISSPTSENSLLRLEKSTNKIYRYTLEQGLPKASGAISFGEDSVGNIWIGFYFGQIVRYKDGKFRDFTGEGLIKPNYINHFLSDKNGRLWLSTAGRGLFRVDEPNAEIPVFTNISMTNGLSSNQTNCLTMDKFGRIYLTTGRGINRIDPETQRVKIFTQNDGLPGNNILACYADVNGNLWFSSLNSLVKYTPEAEKSSASPPIFIDSINVNGKTRAISKLGEKEIKNLELASDERQFQIGFFAISFETGETLRYQYKINDQDWSEPSDRRTVDLNLPQGTHNFAVRAITANGVLSENSATISLTIARPVWQRWWFIILVTVTIGSVGFSFIRYRLRKIREVQIALEALNQSRAERLAELQRVRNRIATDLHDDIGSSLTQISVLSGVARREIIEKKQISTEPLESISAVSNELVEVMSDIVWAINPRKDSLRDLIFRMRRFAADLLTMSDIEFEFETPEADDKTQLGANIRREVFAIFKECINNIVRHSGAKNVDIILEMSDTEIFIKMADDGHGFDTEKILSEDFSPEKGGNGLINMRRRAYDLGGVCEIISSEKGTTTVLKIPLKETEWNKSH